jgi:hypothetical protein
MSSIKTKERMMNAIRENGNLFPKTEALGLHQTSQQEH